MFTRPEDVLNYLHDLLEEQSEFLGLASVGYGTTNLVNGYPACIISSGTTLREIHATQQFLVTFEMNFWIYHADLDASHAQRTQEDLDLVTKIVKFLHSNYTAITPSQPLGQLVWSHISMEEPGVAQTRRSSAVVSTRLVWTGESVVPFTES
jgi:hypothetical protein